MLQEGVDQYNTNHALSQLHQPENTICRSEKFLSRVLCLSFCHASTVMLAIPFASYTSAPSIYPSLLSHTSRTITVVFATKALSHQILHSRPAHDTRWLTSSTFITLQRPLQPHHPQHLPPIDHLFPTQQHKHPLLS